MTVVIRKCHSYDSELIYFTVETIIKELGGIANFVRRGDRVLIKPNLLSAHDPSKHITSHPEIVRSVAKICKDQGAIVGIGDSPALDSFQKVCFKTQMKAISEELNVELVEFTSPTPIKKTEGNVFKRIDVAKQVFEADKIISIPKLKTHSQMLMTLGVKNNFGCVVKQAKAEWHSTAGTSRDLFASLLLDIYLSIKPTLTILDGVWAMEGMGPTNGTPKALGIIAGSEDAILLDLSILTMLNVDWKEFPVYRQAKLRGLIPQDIKPSDIYGLLPYRLKPGEFLIPKLDSMSVIPRGIESLTRKYLISKPMIIDETCQRCGKCMTICPKKAIKMERNKMTIDYDECIRCYCCQEACDKDAIRFKKGLLLKVTEKIF